MLVSPLYSPESEINESYLMSIFVWVKSTVEYLSKTERD